MEPSTMEPTEGQSKPAPKSRKWKLSKKKTILLGCVLILVIGVAVFGLTSYLNAGVALGANTEIQETTVSVGSANSFCKGYPRNTA